MMHLVGSVIGIAVALLIVLVLMWIGWWPTSDDVSTLLAIAIGAAFVLVGSTLSDR
jgi:hypothetical protein